MKWTLGLLAIAALLLAVWTETLTARPTVATDADLVVKGWLSGNPAPLGTPLSGVVDRIETFADTDGDPLYHVVFLDPAGLVIVAADDCVEPIVAFGTGRAYDPAPSNPLGALVVQDLRQRTATAGSQAAGGTTAGMLSTTAGSGRATAARRKWQMLIDRAATAGSGIALAGIPTEEIDDPRVDPLLDIEGIQWGQQTLSCGSACYNYYTPRVVDGEIRWDAGEEDNYRCGCVATAMAQLMRFHRYPTEPILRQEFAVRIIVDEESELEESVTRRLRGGSGTGGRYDWDLMVPQPDCRDESEAQRQEIGALCFDAGLAAGATYGAGTTSAKLTNASAALADVFQYANAVTGWCTDCDMVPDLVGMVNPNLDAAKPVLLSIKRYDDDEVKGHAVVCDGYGYSFSALYHHLNIGWEGQNRATVDIWYNLPDVDTPSREYTALRQCVYNVFPDATGEIISGRVLYRDGSPGGGLAVRAQSVDGSHEHWDITDARGIYALVGCASETEYVVWVEGIDDLEYAVEQRVWTGTSADRCLTSGNRWAIDFPAPADEADRRIVYVDWDAAGGRADGSSWDDAFTDLQEALASLPAALYGDEGVEVWVAAGTYVPAAATEAGRSQSFCLRDGLALYGGFAGGETDRDARDPNAHPTVLSGDLAGDDITVGDTRRGTSRAENSCHVVYSYGCSESRTAILDGFTITAGNASDSVTEARGFGAGIYIWGGRPVLRNCRFVGNQALKRGGAVYTSTSAAPLIVDCTFQGNQTTEGWGGAIFNNDGSEPNIAGCIFADNEASDYSGGAIFNDNDSAPTVARCRFQGNRAKWGGALYNDGDAQVQIQDCNFAGNAANASGGAIYNDANSPAEFSDCTFAGNTAHWGGAVYSYKSPPLFQACRFTGNHADYGGAIYLYEGSAGFAVCHFADNAADTSGGAVYAASGTVWTIADCEFLGNEAVSGWGGAIFNNDDSEPNITGCVFSNNRALEHSGGAIFSDNGSATTLTDCGFEANQAAWGGAVFNDNDSRADLRDCTFTDNTAQWGGATYNDESSQAEFRDCHFAYNTADTSGGAIYNNDGATATIIDCGFEANQADWGGALYNDNESVVRVIGCRFTDNRALGESGGAMRNRAGSQPYLANCEFRRNRAGFSGGAVHNYGCSCEAINCLFAENGTTASSSYGGVMRNYSVDALCELTFVNCTFVGNEAAHGNVLVCDSGDDGLGSDVRLTNCILCDEGLKVRTYDGSSVTFRYSAVVGGIDAAASSSAVLVWGLGNISSDPRLQADSYHLRPDSPCIDAGDNAALSDAVETDLDGLPRFRDGDGDSDPVVDMGAYEYQ